MFCLSKKISLFETIQGLGKTIEAIAGMVLRDALANARGDAGRPSFVVGPNKPVLRQWQDAFLLNGYRPERLQFFRSGQDNVDFRYNKVILFADRYTLQAELKSIFDAISKMEFHSPFPNPKRVLASCTRSTSVLWPSLSQKNLFNLWLQYIADKGKLRDFKLQNQERRKDEYLCDCVTRLVAATQNKVAENKSAVFETVVFDEVSTFKTRETYYCFFGQCRLTLSIFTGSFSEESVRLLGDRRCPFGGSLAALCPFDRHAIL